MIDISGVMGDIMKTKYSLIALIIQLIVGIAAIISFVIIAMSGENMTRWIVTLILSIGFVVLGIIGIMDYKSQNKGE